MEPTHLVVAVTQRALVYKHPYLGILACCRECRDEVVRRDLEAGRINTAVGESYVMLPPAGQRSGSVPWDQRTLAAAHDVAHAHMAEVHCPPLEVWVDVPDDYQYPSNWEPVTVPTEDVPARPGGGW